MWHGKTPCSRMVIRQPPIDGRKTEYMAELIDEDGHAASSGFIYTSPQHWHSNTKNIGFKGGMQEKHEEVQLPFHFLALLEDVVEGKTIWIKKDNNILWQKDRPMQKPKLGNIVAQIDGDLRLKLSWDYFVPVDEQPTVWLRWSDDQGNSWNGLSVGIRKDFAELDINDLPAGQLIFQVVSHDGFYTVKKTSPSVTLPERAPMIFIILPRAGPSVRANNPLRLLGAMSSRSQNILKEEDFVWHIDGKEVGRGLDTWVKNPGKGKHKVGLEVRDPAGHSGVSTSIEVE